MGESDKLEDFVLYHGSLAELNERASFQAKRYIFSGELSGLGHVNFGGDIGNVIEAIKEKFRIDGHDGLVNVRTSVSYSRSGYSVVIEGTPIKRFLE